MSVRLTLSRLLVAALALWSVSASAWWDETWPYRLPVAINTTATGADVAEDVENFPVLVKLHSGNFEDFFLVKEDLSDIRFVAADDQTLLSHHVESFDIINQLIYVWVKVPKISGNLNTERIWMYYGNFEAPSVADSAASYGEEVASVYHFNDIANGAVDASGKVAVPQLINAEFQTSSMIAGGLNLNGTASVFTAPESLQNVDATGMTMSFWLKTSELSSNSVVAEIIGSSQSVSVRIDNGLLALAAGGVNDVQAPALAANNWHNVVVVLGSQSAELYLDGVRAGATAITSIGSVSQITIGADVSGASGFIGEVDELKIDAVSRTPGYIKLQYASQSIMGNMLGYQQGEQLGSGGSSSSFWAIIINSTESSGWTIIALLGLMAAISWLVMLGKSIYISSASKDNQKFIEQYRTHSSDDPALLDHDESAEDKELNDSPILQAMFGSHDHFQSSPIYRVYHRGIQEVKGRIGSTVGAKAASLSPSAVNAIKAALDAQMIREAQRLNSKMVLLTIAISGGPFLGLMGTVVGVMITFAAIAASGDVNISAIAPGVAAALLTTVAGLVVAIPALFGYNYLASKIKENISDMRVFSDEFITRVAEYYGRS